MPGISAILPDCGWSLGPAALSAACPDSCCAHISCAETLALKYRRKKINIANSADFFIATVGLLSLSDACKGGHTPCALAGTIIDDRLFRREFRYAAGLNWEGLRTYSPRKLNYLAGGTNGKTDQTMVLQQ